MDVACLVKITSTQAFLPLDGPGRAYLYYPGIIVTVMARYIPVIGMCMPRENISAVCGLPGGMRPFRTAATIASLPIYRARTVQFKCPNIQQSMVAKNISFNGASNSSYKISSICSLYNGIWLISLFTTIGSLPFDGGLGGELDRK